jgi:hypothetical protein
MVGMMMKMKRIREWLWLLDRRGRQEPETVVAAAAKRILARVEHEPFFEATAPLSPATWALLSYWTGVLVGAGSGGGSAVWLTVGTAMVIALGWFVERQ